jgi:hypothetical protein
MGQHADHSLVGQDTQVRGSEHHPGGGDDITDVHVTTGLAYGIAWSQLAADRDAASVGLDHRLLNHAHGICSRGDRCAGHDARRLARAHRPAIIVPITASRTGAPTVSQARMA